MIVLDTNVLSELMRPNPSLRVLAWMRQLPRPQMAVTAITEAEIFYGVELLPQGKRKNQFLSEAESMFAEDFRGRTLPFDSEAARLYAKIASARRAKGKPISVPDAQIAAIVLAHNAVLATRNIMDFAGCGVQIVNPWKEK
ncbi:MAG TPA: type II toxin-antitoxin system VapC family toxin [Acidobacteriaceae bacterium]|nr:type II toxin-antitoxin system VapC family toxin [Acidobacteriaceae bacterium]